MPLRQHSPSLCCASASPFSAAVPCYSLVDIMVYAFTFSAALVKIVLRDGIPLLGCFREAERSCRKEATGQVAM